MSNKWCPKCGGGVWDEFGHIGGELHRVDDIICLRRQLSQRDERIAELEAENERLREDRAWLVLYRILTRKGKDRD